MLHLMRRKLKRLKIVLWIVIFGLTVGMLLLFVDVGGRGDQGMTNTAVASIDGQEIDSATFRQEYYRMQERYRRQFGENADQFFKVMRLGDTTMDSLIKNIVVQREAKRLGLEVTAAEVLDYLRKIPALSENGRFIGRTRMEQILQSNNTSLQEFEHSVTSDLLNLKLRSIVTGGIRVSEKEIRDQFSESNQKATIEYVAFKGEEFSKNVTLTDSELSSYFEKNKENYRIGEQRRIQFLSIPEATFQAKIQVSEQEIRQELNNLEDQTEVRARHILFKIEGTTKEDEIRSKAMAVLEEARKGGDFAALAKTHSQDAGSAVNGGDLGFFKAGAMVPEFSNAAFSLQPGQISDLVQTQFGFHIIKVEERRSATPEQNRLLAEQKIRAQKADTLGQQAAAEIVGLLRSGQDIQKVAAEKNLQVGESGFFRMEGVIPGLGNVAGLQSEVFNLKNIGEVAAPVKSGAGYLVAKWIEKKDPSLPLLSEVQSKVTEDCKAEKGVQQAQAKAKTFSQALRSGEDFTALAKKYSVQIARPGAFSRQTSIDDTLRTNRDVMQAVFSAQVGVPSEAIQVDKIYTVFRLLSLNPFDEVAYAKERSTIRQALQDRRKVTFYQAYLEKVEQGLRDQKKIVVNQSLIDQIVG